MPASRVRDRASTSQPDIGRANEAAISATTTERPSVAELTALDGLARNLEVRADLAGDLDARALREHFEGTLVYSLRSAGRGGRSSAGVDERRRRLLAAARTYDLVDLEHGNDLEPDLLSRIPPERRRVSWHGPVSDLAALSARFERMSEVPARLYLLAPRATSIEHGLAPLRLLQSLRRTDVTAFATGAAGTWSRLLAPRLGARVVYGRLQDGDGSGVPSVRELSADYGLPMMGRLRELFGIVGGSVSRSLAPRIYNRGFRALGLPALCLPFCVDDFDVFWRELVEAGLPGLGAPVRGLTVVSPNKEEALDLATLTTVGAREAGAANSLVRAGDAWQGATTTRLAGPLDAAEISPAGRNAAVVGCGGAGRAIAAELRRAGAAVTLVNRGDPRGRYASRLLGLPWISLSEFSPRRFDLLINATPLAKESPFAVDDLANGTVVVDLAYIAGSETSLVAAARARGHVVVDGRDVLAAETGYQFQFMTGQPLPPDALAIARGEPGVI